ncbi:Fur family transcriptional regulator [uncultured Desulfuromusa sp.]|uniref:Fur family transcriptional regulator n=1 Tax=uncultured Desulfuromusa sp. TaxID=219183 RepID=UPI002AA8E211|nr:Fur family transcriptional regulator [uncultured Desulfuromusa sp.]
MDFLLSKRLDVFTKVCRERNLRLTPQRLEIFKKIAQATDHPTAEKLHQRLIEGMPTLSLDTVYRTLGTFLDIGLISKVDTIESQARFEVSEFQHHHLICEQCHKIIDFEWRQVDELELPDQVQSLGNFKRKKVVVYGICQDCLK